MKQRLLAVSLALCACQAPPEPPEETHSTSTPIIDGDPDTDDPAVVLILMQNQTNGAKCSGTVVAPHVIATAAHCVHPDVLATLGADVAIYVFTGTDVNDPQQLDDDIVYVDTVAYDPDFDPESVMSNSPPLHDIGAVITKTALPMAPLPIRRSPLDETWVGRDARVVGFGLTEAGDSESAGVKQVGTVAIAGVNETHVWTDQAAPHLCGGDSGGPMLGLENGVESLIGVHSWIEHLNSCTGEAHDVRVDTQMVAFLDPLIAEYDPGFQPPSEGTGEGGAAGGTGQGGQSVGGAEASQGGGSSAGDDDDGCSSSSSRTTGHLGALALLGVLALRSSRRTRFHLAARVSAPSVTVRTASDGSPPA